ncbi:MAG: hypothetical protein HXS48_20900 [Theionarchaea archaeon]|nr:hypothetical protein [Theionarchaea archaeon]
MEIIEIIITAGLSGVIGAGTGILSNICWRKITYLRPIKKLLCDLANDSQKLKIFVPIFSIPQFAEVKDRITGRKAITLDNITEITSKDSAECLPYVLSLLREVRAHRNLEIVNSEEFRESDLDSNMICIGGPLTNKVTEKIMSSEESWMPYKYEKEEEKIIKVMTENREWVADLETDYGVIIKTKNPFFSGKWIFIFFGISGCGTVGAGYYFWSSFKDLVDQFGNRPFGIVVRVNRRIGYISATQVDYVTQGV